eukprot:CAMPEP_0170583784 /NCGR_PEP_ID=MMETSP0224-20130122/8329_1 /TAXON_ID=285029 /ORGANISM="Togula jolla, Strain CCCM 725" /LENGTH=70 /DNA_ID=CAMNT_0010907153 /DNA_START=338 /DNA_END=550 /DNA_ORIENTATION=+
MATITLITAQAASAVNPALTQGLASAVPSRSPRPRGPDHSVNGATTERKHPCYPPLQDEANISSSAGQRL